MGGKLSEMGIARDEGTARSMTIAPWLVLIALLLVAGCAGGNNGNNSDNAKDGGFYSGVSGGWSHP